MQGLLQHGKLCVVGDERQLEAMGELITRNDPPFVKQPYLSGRVSSFEKRPDDSLFCSIRADSSRTCSLRVSNSLFCPFRADTSALSADTSFCCFCTSFNSMALMRW